MREIRPLRWLLLLGALAAAVLWLWSRRAPSFDGVANLAAPGRAVVVLGDSIPAGYGEGVGPQRAWPALVAARLGLELVNRSVSGETTAGGLARVDADVVAARPRLAIVELGGNDFLHRIPPQATAANLEEIFRRIQAAGALVVFVGVKTPSKPEYQEVFEQTTRRAGVHYVPDVLSGVALRPSLMADPIHPGAAGHEKIAERLTRELSALLAAADRAREGAAP